jgi:hypothetical protein
MKSESVGTGYFVGINLGRKLKSEGVGIANMFRRGKSYLEIAESVGIYSEDNEELSGSVAKTAIYSVLRGYDGGSGGVSYRGVMKRVEFEKLRNKHYKDGGKKSRPFSKFWDEEEHRYKGVKKSLRKIVFKLSERGEFIHNGEVRGARNGSVKLEELRKYINRQYVKKGKKVKVSMLRNVLYRERKKVVR